MPLPIFFDREPVRLFQKRLALHANIPEDTLMSVDLPLLQITLINSFSVSAISGVGGTACGRPLPQKAYYLCCC